MRSRIAAESVPGPSRPDHPVHLVRQIPPPPPNLPPPRPTRPICCCPPASFSPNGLPLGWGLRRRTRRDPSSFPRTRPARVRSPDFSGLGLTPSLPPKRFARGALIRLQLGSRTRCADALNSFKIRGWTPAAAGYPDRPPGTAAQGEASSPDCKELPATVRASASLCFSKENRSVEICHWPSGIFEVIYAIFICARNQFLITGSSEDRDPRQSLPMQPHHTLMLHGEHREGKQTTQGQTTHYPQYALACSGSHGEFTMVNILGRASGSVPLTR